MTVSAANISISPKVAAILATVVESKVTRGEVVELALQSLRASLEAEIAATSKELEKHEKEPKLSQEEAVKVMKTAGLYAIVEPASDWDLEKGDERFTFKIHVKVQPEQLPKRVRESAKKRLELRLHKKSCERTLERLRGAGTAARAALIRMALDASPEGKSLLNAVDGLKDQLSAQLSET